MLRIKNFFVSYSFSVVCLLLNVVVYFKSVKHDMHLLLANLAINVIIWRQVGGFLWVLRFPPPIKLTDTIQLKYCWKCTRSCFSWCLGLIWHFIQNVKIDLFNLIFMVDDVYKTIQIIIDY
jgi:hypothetical protein